MAIQSVNNVRICFDEAGETKNYWYDDRHDRISGAWAGLTDRPLREIKNVEFKRGLIQFYRGLGGKYENYFYSRDVGSADVDGVLDELKNFNLKKQWQKNKI